MDTGTRTGISYLSNDGSDAVTAYRTSIRSVVTALEAKGALASQTVLGSRPAAGTGLRFWKDAGSLGDGILYFDNGSTWEAVGAGAPTDGPAGTPSLRTLGSGSTQAAAGNHTHAADAITGFGGDNYILALMGAL